MIASKFFELYKRVNIIIKLFLLVFIPIMAILWIIGSLTFFDRLLMFIVGLITGCILIYIYYPEIYPYINNIVGLVKEMLGA